MNRTRRATESVYSSELYPLGVTEEEYRSWVLAHRDPRVSWGITRRGASVRLTGRLLPEASLPDDALPVAVGTIAVCGWPLVVVSAVLLRAMRRTEPGPHVCPLEGAAAL